MPSTYIVVNVFFFKAFLENKYGEMLTNALRALVNNLFKENFYGKRKKKTINILIVLGGIWKTSSLFIYIF